MVLDVLDLYPDLGENVKKRFDDLVSKANERNLTAPESKEIENVMEEMAQAYTTMTGGDYDKIMEDASKIMGPLEKEDCEHSRQLARNYYAIVLENLKPLIATGKGEKGFNVTMKAIKETEKLYNYAYSFICSHVGQQLAALEHYNLDTNPLLLKVEEKAAQWYEKPQDWKNPAEDGEPPDLATMQKINNKRIPQSVIAKEVLGIDYPIDKVNGNIWNLLAGAEKNGQLAIRFNMAKHNSGKNAFLIYSINFDNLPENISVSKKLTPFDKRVMISAAALFNAGNEIVSASQIYEKMGNTGRPSAKAVKKINDSILKMNSARIILDNTFEGAGEEAETETYNKRSVKTKYKGSLFPMELVEAYINNQFVESAIHLFREPPLVTFARDRHQITTVEPKLLQSPISKTDANLMIDDYLIDRISKMKRAKQKKKQVITKILFSTLFESCRINTKMQKSRAPEKIKAYLDYYKQCGFIAGYTMLEDGIEIKL